MKKLILLLALFTLTFQAQAQTAGGLFSGGMNGVRTYGGIGFTNFNVKTNSLDLNNGLYIYLGGEKSINDDGLSATITLSYMKTDGTASYDYTTQGGSRFQGNNVDFDMNTYQLALGLRQRFFPSSWFRPYIEGGGTFGYHDIKYNTRNVALVSGPAGGSIKSKDDTMGFGYYGEGGTEIDFSEAFGIRVGARYQYTDSKSLETIGNQKLQYDAITFIFAALLRF